MGEVWKCLDTHLQRIVVIKTVNLPYLQTNPDAPKVLRDEARAGAMLIGHPNAVAVLDVDEFSKDTDSSYFIAMEYVDGLNLAQWISSVKPVLDAQTYYWIGLLIAHELCAAITFAHRNRILHRDIKPLNVFLTKYGVTKLGDFGLSRDNQFVCLS